MPELKHYEIACQIWFNLGSYGLEQWRDVSEEEYEFWNEIRKDLEARGYESYIDSLWN